MVGNQYLLGNFAPVLEEITEHELQVIGTLPKVNGSFMRNGSNPLFPPPKYHWFDGDGMIHAVEISDGRASYSNRFIQTEGYLKEKEARKSLYGGLIAGPPFKNVANISVISHHGKTLATWEGGSPYEFLPSDLSTVGLYNFGNQWPWAFTAHPKMDADTGEMYLFGYDIRPPYLRYGVIDRSGKLTHSSPIEIPHPVMMHDFAITTQYAVFLDLPLLFTPHGYVFRAEAGARIGVIPRKGTTTDMKWFPIEPCWVYHVVNAYEDGGIIVLRACRYPNWKGKATLHEWRLDLNSGTVTEKQLDTSSVEFPVINPSFIGKNNRYSYIAHTPTLGTASAIIKYDLQEGISSTHMWQPGCFSGETCFVPDPTRAREDGGWLFNFVYNQDQNKSECVILSSETMEVLATISLPRRVPFGLHSAWIPTK